MQCFESEFVELNLNWIATLDLNFLATVFESESV